eukprot:COSAG02_NODE_5730_length_4084_cov_2.138269_1_plen_88_part_00
MYTISHHTLKNCFSPKALVNLDLNGNDFEEACSEPVVKENDDATTNKLFGLITLNSVGVKLDFCSLGLVTSGSARRRLARPAHRRQR